MIYAWAVYWFHFQNNGKYLHEWKRDLFYRTDIIFLFMVDIVPMMFMQKNVKWNFITYFLVKEMAVYLLGNIGLERLFIADSIREKY